MGSLNRLAVVMIAVLVVGGLATAAAYNSFTVDRDANIDVVADDVGIIGLNPGNSSFVFLQNDVLQIDVTSGGASGVNVDSTLLIGDSTSPTTSYAFSVTNNDQNQRDLTYSYTATDDEGDTSDNVAFTLYASDGTQVGTFSEEADATVAASSGEVQYVVMEVNSTSLTTTADLSGTLSITSQ